MNRRDRRGTRKDRFIGIGSTEIGSSEIGSSESVQQKNGVYMKTWRMLSTLDGPMNRWSDLPIFYQVVQYHRRLRGAPDTRAFCAWWGASRIAPGALSGTSSGPEEGVTTDPPSSPGSPDRAVFAGPIRSAFFAERMGRRAGVGSHGLAWNERN
jgi:hypothetical protein